MNKSVLSDRVRAALEKANVGAWKIKQVEAALQPEKPPVKLSRNVIERIQHRVANEGVAVVTAQSVFSFDGYARRIRSGRIQAQRLHINRAAKSQAHEAVPA